MFPRIPSSFQHTQMSFHHTQMWVFCHMIGRVEFASPNVQMPSFRPTDSLCDIHLRGCGVVRIADTLYLNLGVWLVGAREERRTNDVPIFVSWTQVEFRRASHIAPHCVLFSPSGVEPRRPGCFVPFPFFCAVSAPADIVDVMFLLCWGWI